MNDFQLVVPVRAVRKGYNTKDGEYDYPYRHGDLGMLHPLAVNYFNSVTLSHA